MSRGELIAIIENARNAMKYVADSWSSSQLAAAVSELAGPIAECDKAIEWWERDDT